MFGDINQVQVLIDIAVESLVQCFSYFREYSSCGIIEATQINDDSYCPSFAPQESPEVDLNARLPYYGKYASGA